MQNYDKLWYLVFELFFLYNYIFKIWNKTKIITYYIYVNIINYNI